jgi:hypothetical protein
VLEDLVIPMNARKLGYRVLYDPEAIGMTFAASSVAGEFTGASGRHGELPSAGTDSAHAARPVTAFAFFSHKFLRWILPFRSSPCW